MNETLLEGYETSPAQEQAWALRSSLAGPVPAYARLSLRGPLDVTALSEALRAIWDRHEILRTRMVTTRGLALPIAVVSDEPLTIDIGGPAGPVDSETHVRLVRVSDDEHLLVLPADGIDAVSVEALAAELAAELTGTAPAVDVLQYADFSGWHREILSSPTAGEGGAYWRALDLAGPSDAHLPYHRPLSLDRPRTLFRAPINVDSSVAQRFECPFRDVLLACWSGLLSRIAGRDVLVGTAFDGRGYDELAGAIGPYTRYLPVSVRTDGSLVEVCERVSAMLAGHTNWQEYFTADMLPDPEGYRYAFDYAEIGEPHRAGAVTIRAESRRTYADPFRLRLVATCSPDGLELVLEHDDSLATADVEYLADELAALLDGIEPDQSFGDADLLTAQRRQEVVHGFNATGATLDLGTLHGMIEAATDRHPQRDAVVVGTDRITYSELDRRANQVAHALMTNGIRAGHLVAVCLDRSVDAAAAIFGVLKTGAAYVPLDPAHPVRRLRELAADTEMVITDHDELSPRLTLAETDAHPTSRPQVDVAMTDLAYVIYTSGSTGTPKGVMIDHRGAANTIVDVNTRYGISARDKVFGVSALTFDLSVYDLLGALAVGATLVWPTPDRAKDPAAWVRLVNEHEVTVWDSVPALLEAVVRQARADELASLRLAMLSGDWIPLNLPDRARGRIPGLRVVSMGGATEGSIWSIWHPVGEVDQSLSSIPYGSPLANQRFHVLDARMRPCPAWTAGELAIGGHGVALGYWGQPALTATRFVPDPHGEPGARLYRTGDRGRRWTDGTIEFLGRIDDQVKLRGFRVEPGETAAMLLRHPEVAAVVATVRVDEGLDARLVAYVVPVEGHAPLQAGLRAYCAERLPNYLVPAAIVIVDEFPLTDNGKVDFNALPAPQRRTAEYVAPRTPLEEELIEMWEALLGVPRIGVHDDFFALGGHSLLLARLGTEIQEAFGAEVPLRELFEAATVERMTEAILASQLAEVDADEAARLLAEVGQEERP